MTLSNMTLSLYHFLLILCLSTFCFLNSINEWVNVKENDSSAILSSIDLNYKELIVLVSQDTVSTERHFFSVSLYVLFSYVIFFSVILRRV